MAKTYLSKAQEAERIGLSTRTLDRLCARDGYPFIQVGGTRRFDPEKSDRYLATRTVGANAEVARAA